MNPSVTVLQLDTRFPRVPGDVACAETYNTAVEVIRVGGASVDRIVSDQPNLIDIAPFEKALDQAQGDAIVTSCGFLSSWQDHLAARTTKPFVSSALIALSGLSRRFTSQELLIITFDKANLTDLHFGDHADYRSQVVGLPEDMHLRQVISQDQATLDVDLARRELVKVVKDAQRPHHRHILLECTNLPPYKTDLVRHTGLEITDILTCTEGALPGSIRSQFLGERDQI